MSLAEQGVDKGLADQARKAAKMDEAQYAKQVAKKVKFAVAAAENDKAVITAARAERHTEKKKKRTERETKLAAKIMALPKKKYGVVVADPEWKFEAWSEKFLGRQPLSDLAAG